MLPSRIAGVLPITVILPLSGVLPMNAIVALWGPTTCNICVASGLPASTWLFAGSTSPLVTVNQNSTKLCSAAACPQPNFIRFSSLFGGEVVRVLLQQKLQQPLGVGWGAVQWGGVVG